MSNVYVKTWEQVRSMEQRAEALAMGTPVHELSLIQMHVLDGLYFENGQHASSLARTTGRAATSFTPILDSLERRGLICRKDDPNDRRAIYVHLTPDGEALRGDVQKVLVQLNGEFSKKILFAKS